MARQKIKIGDTLTNAFSKQFQSGEIGETINEKLLNTQGKMFEKVGITRDGIGLAGVEDVQKGKKFLQ